MSIKTKIETRIISGCRVRFDPRSTAEAHETRSDINYKALEQSWRKEQWRMRQARDHD